MPATIKKAEALLISGTAAEITAKLAEQVCWPDDQPLPSGAAYALVVDLTDEDPSLIIEVLNAKLDVIERVVL